MFNINDQRIRVKCIVWVSLVGCISVNFACCNDISCSFSAIVLENLTVVPDSLSSVFLEWDVNPTDGYHCITDYTIQVTSQNGSQWEAQTPGNISSFLLSGLRLTPLQEYTYCITANIPPNQVGPTVKEISTVELYGMLNTCTSRSCVLDSTANPAIIL